MISEIYQCEFITPCFGAGALQTEAELRAPEVRGQLRWWFRALGGTLDQESLIFGSVNGNASASALQVRTQIVKQGTPWKPRPVITEASNAYIWYYASASNNGSRWTAKGNLPPGTEFDIHIRVVRAIPSDVNKLFRMALGSFLLLGALGMRVTRGLGAFSCKQLPATRENLESQRTVLEEHSFCCHEEDSNPSQNWEDCISLAGNILKTKLREKYPAGRNGDKQSPLGASKKRQTSAVYLRPIKQADGTYSLVIFEAPAVRVLGVEARRGAPVLRSVFPQT